MNLPGINDKASHNKQEGDMKSCRDEIAEANDIAAHQRIGFQRHHLLRECGQGDAEAEKKAERFHAHHYPLKIWPVAFIIWSAAETTLAFIS